MGWIKGAEKSFVNDRDALRLEDFRGVELDAGRLDYFRRYLDKYFNDQFIEGQGAEEILATLAQHGTSGSWLDLGAGTTTLFWSIPLTGISAVSCCDLVVEALAVLDEFARSDRIPPCYREALARCRRPESHLAALRRRIGPYLVFDTLARWPSWLVAEPFDLITAFGNFGIAPDPERYAGCFVEVARHLAAGGRAVGADWVRWPDFIARDGHDNSYLAPGQIARAGRAAGLAVRDCREVPIAGDPCYRAVICWAMEKPA